MLFLAACLALGSLQGIYTTAPGTGQLAHISNISAPQLAPVGPALAAQGFSVPPAGCGVAVAIDQTRKLHYTLARNASAPGGEWSLVGVQLETGLVRTAQLLPKGFSLPSRCSHTLDVDDADRVLVAAPQLLAPEPAARERGSSGAGPRLSLKVVRISPDTGKTEILSAGAPPPPRDGAPRRAVSAAAGQQQPPPSSAFHDLSNTLWLQLGASIVGFNVTSRAVDRSVRLPAGTAGGLAGLSFDVYTASLLTTVQEAGAGMSIGSFDPGALAPALALTSVAPRALSSVINDSRSLTVVQDKGVSTFVVVGASPSTPPGSWAYVHLDHTGTAIGAAEACAKEAECPSSVLFEPFVFRS
jgi:hypothetical protein